MTLEQIARLVAPILWFSPDEPLRLRGEAVPSAHPCDRPGRGPVVYYQALRIQLRSNRRVTLPVEEDPEFFAKAESVVIRFYFYYSADVGFSGHRHDLEIAEFQVRLDQQGDCGQVRVQRVAGFAHGVDWYANRLVVTADTHFPITLLVEEGKHASCPDRNADGLYSPGYDVNRWAADAWGIRDVLGSGFLGAASYQAWMTKRRRFQDRVLPPPADTRCVSPLYSSYVESRQGSGVYELRRASTIRVRSCSAEVPDRRELVSLMKSGRFGAEHPTAQSTSSIAANFSDPVHLTQRLIPNVALRYDSEDLGFSFTVAGFDLRLFYVAPKFNFMGRNDWSMEALVTTSAARVASPYLTFGLGREQLGGSAAEWRFVSEAGGRFRYRLTGWKRVFGLGYHFAGVRFGLRATGFDAISRFHFVVEVGAGAW